MGPMSHALILMRGLFYSFVTVTALLNASDMPAGGAGVWGAAAMIGDASSSALKDLAEQRAQLRRQRDDVNRQIRNGEKKRARLIERARNLSNADLLSILGSRAAAKAKAKPAAKRKAMANTNDRADSAVATANDGDANVAA